MPAADGDRTKFFPLIEKKHGGPISLWIDRLRDLGDAKYPEQIAYLKEEHGFSQAHANALVMYVRGSATSKRFTKATDYYKTIDPAAAKTCKDIFAAITKKWPGLELVMAWNKPMLRNEKGYVIGLAVAKNHILIAPFSTRVLEDCADKLAKFEVGKKTFKVPVDWKVNATLLQAVAKARLDELK